MRRRIVLVALLVALAAACSRSSSENDVKPLTGKRIPEGAGPDKDKK